MTQDAAVAHHPHTTMRLKPRDLGEGSRFFICNFTKMLVSVLLSKKNYSVEKV